MINTAIGMATADGIALCFIYIFENILELLKTYFQNQLFLKILKISCYEVLMFNLRMYIAYKMYKKFEFEKGSRDRNKK